MPEPSGRFLIISSISFSSIADEDEAGLIEAVVSPDRGWFSPSPSLKKRLIYIASHKKTREMAQDIPDVG